MSPANPPVAPEACPQATPYITSWHEARRLCGVFLCVTLVLTCLQACSTDPETQPDEMNTADASSDASAVVDMEQGDTPLDSAEEVDLTAMSDMSDVPDMLVRPELLDPVKLTTDEEILAAVNPFIGTGGQGFGYAAMTPAAQLPLGLVKVGPDTTSSSSHGSQQHMSGYNDLDPHVRGFSHLHFVGTGVADYGNLRVYPSRTLDRVGTRGWFATHDRTTEEASPGYYTTELVEPAVKVELTPSLRGAAHRYTFKGDEAVHIAVDVTSSVIDRDALDAAVEVDVSTGEVHGWVLYQGGYVGRRFPFKLHFVMQTNVPPDDALVWHEDGLLSGQTSLPSGEHEQAGAVLSWQSPPDSPIELRVGLSLVDEQGARAHLEQEVPFSKSFEQIHDAARQSWIERLSAIRVAGGTASERAIFYTALYNAFRMPTRFDDHDGRYPGLDQQIHIAPHPYYTDLSLWDSFRTTHPLYDLIAPDVQRDVLLSLLAMHRDGGVIPRWPAALSYTGGMVGSSADMLFGGSAAKGLDGVPWDEALAATLEVADGLVPETALGGGRNGIEPYIALGYVPAEASSGSASVTLEYAYNDWAVHHLATAAGDQATASRFLTRSSSYKNLFDADSRFFRARHEDGSFVEKFNPKVVEDRSGANFVEGSAWHYRFYALQDLEGLVELLGGPAELATLLTTLFEESSFGESILGRNFLPEPYYWHGNQPPIHSVSLFAFSATPDAQHTWLERLRQTYYDETPAGLPGNDDGGTLSSWYVFHALGFYPIAGSDQYILGSPIFTLAQVRLQDGALLNIGAPDTSPWRRVVSEVQLDGAPVDTAPRLSHGSLAGATLRFLMKEAAP